MEHSSNNIFKFKQFSVNQEGASMKINTDGVLIGAWAVKILKGTLLKNKEYQIKRALDIGCGTGVIALMLAQSFDCKIDGIDVDLDSHNCAKENFAASPWRERIKSYHFSLQNFVKSTNNKYSLIVSNPPFFNSSLKNPDKKKSVARHTETLSYKELIVNSLQLLSDDGFLFLILPSESIESLLEIAHKNFLYERAICYVSHRKEGKNKRVMLSLGKGLDTPPIIQKLAIEEKKKNSANFSKSAEFCELIKNFYI